MLVVRLKGGIASQLGKGAGHSTCLMSDLDVREPEALVNFRRFPEKGLVWRRKKPDNRL